MTLPDIKNSYKIKIILMNIIRNKMQVLKNGTFHPSLIPNQNMYLFYSYNDTYTYE